MPATSTLIILALHYSDIELGEIGYQFCILQFIDTRKFQNLHGTVWRETLAGGNIGEFGELSVIRQTKTIQISTYN